MAASLIFKVRLFLLTTVSNFWIEYFISNTMNWITRRIDSFLWTYKSQLLVVDVYQETPEIRTITLLPNHLFNSPKPGQYIELSIPIDGEVYHRCYSISKIDGDLISITVKKKNGGAVSTWLHESLCVGDVMRTSQPRGHFVYNGQNNLLFICAGVGITPCYSVIRQVREQVPPPHLSLFYRCQSESAVCFKKELMSWKECDFSYSSQEDAIEQQLRDCYPDITDKTIYLCGPPSFSQRVVEYLEGIGYDFNRLIIEHFETVGVDRTGAMSSSGHLVHINQANRSIRVLPGTPSLTILELAESEGVFMEHGCRMGMCGTCRRRLVSGEVIGQQVGDYIYPCVCLPASSEVVIE